MTSHTILCPDQGLPKRLSATLPPLTGAPLHIRFLPGLTADRQRVYSNESRGQPVHASTHIRKREIVLNSDLRRHPKELSRILVHEVFHFAWVRLSNPVRASYEEMIRLEFAARARGELGWSAEWRKESMRDRAAQTGVRWREYLCESFCDTAAWIYSDVEEHDEFTLAAGYRARRAQWFQTAFRGSRIPI